MKSTTKLVFTLALSLLLLSYACKDYTNGANQNQAQRPDIALTYSELISMLEHYDKTKKNQIANAVGLKEDTRINNFKLEDLKAYIAYVEFEAKKKNIKVTGINFISAAYPKNHSDKEKRNYQTLIMMPATTINGVADVSFDPLKSEKGKPKSLKEILDDMRNYPWYYDAITISKSRSKSKSNKSGDDLSIGGNRAGITPPF